MQQQLETERLILRQWHSDDLTAFASINQDPRVMQYFPSTLDIAETRQFIKKIKQHFKQHGYGFFCCALKSSNLCIGFVGLNVPNFEAHFMPNVEIGWRLAFNHWGKGYATEAAMRMLDYGFNELALHEIVSFTVPANTRSRRVMEKIGMLHDPKDNFKHPQLACNHPLSLHVLYRLSENNYLSQHKMLPE